MAPITLRVATFNLWMANEHLRDDDKFEPSPKGPGWPPVPVFFTNEQRLQLIAQRLNNVIKPDICFFSEIDKNTDRSKLSNGTRVNQAEWLAKNTPLEYWLFDPYTLDYQWGQVGNAILSRFPIDKSFSHLLTSPGQDYGTSIPEIYITIQGIQFRCLATHFHHRNENLRYEGRSIYSKCSITSKSGHTCNFWRRLEPKAVLPFNK